MAVVWNGNGGSYQEHDERMRWFRRSHASVAMASAPREEGPSLAESTRPLSLGEVIVELGGTRLSSASSEWSNLMLLPRVARYKLSPN
ncbi:MAG TPA: hypothetical protein G4O01_04100 [Dehalococcoidia bacterium]|jgi:hypothetical protein|nr:hypothetical protein [Dehalococcoidia bacterium]